VDRTPGIRPRPTLLRQLDAASRHAFPVACTNLLVLAASAPLGLPGQSALQPATALGCVFFWSLFRPASMSPLAVFLIGLLCDLLGLSPVGASVLTLLVVHGVAMRWRRVLVRQNFPVVWLAFLVLAVGAALLQWALTCALTLTVLPVEPVAFQVAVTAGLYPLLSRLFVQAHRGLADPRQA